MTGNEQKNSPGEFIQIQGARVHNLKNIDTKIPRNSLTVITGLSGSGKSSLAFDTLYADGQRRYVESLSAYARQFLGRMSKPEVDFIKGVSPAIAIEQKVNIRNPRSTVGTSTEIYEYLKLLFSRIGKTYSPVSGNLVKRHSVSDVTNFILGLPESDNVLILAPVKIRRKNNMEVFLQTLSQQGFTRIFHNSEIIRIKDINNDYLSGLKNESALWVVIDRIIVEKNGESQSRIADSVQTAFFEGNGECILIYGKDGDQVKKVFSNKFELDDITFEEPTVNLFAFNNPYGACKKCEGFGSIIGIDEDLVIPDKSLSIYEDAIACWRGEKMSEWKDVLVMNAYKFGFPVHKPFHELTEEQKELLWTGNEYFEGIDRFFQFVEEQAYKIQYRVMLSRYRGKTVCPECKGTRLRKDANYVRVAGKSISEMVLMPVSELRPFMEELELSENDEQIARRLLIEIRNRLKFLEEVGLGYLTLNRLSNTLSGGESQRINLANSLGSSLVGSMYILDEPSIGLHPRDTQNLIQVLKQLRDLGNTVIVVEHDRDIIQAADYIIDMGPLAGSLGGNVIYQGDASGLVKAVDSLTADYLTGKRSITLPAQRRKWKHYLKVNGAHENNLKYISTSFPLEILTVVTGVSGSGKSSLVREVLYPTIKRIHGGYSGKAGKLSNLSGDTGLIGNVEMVDQNPIGRSSRSNPATYLKAFDEIRTLFSQQALSRIRGYKPGYFSFNVPGGRCEECEGEGVVKIEMQFMADIYLTCESCSGTRYKPEVLDIKYQEKNISDIL
ncbi:MAG: excinuclease ABC subunit UvrA, partial [Bacteroidetes bacterium]|nr:excinuclease ABC subunit UvrA [Bacteroidota bacterium]